MTSKQTQLIHDGYERSHYGETSEALYLTSGFVYQSAEQAEARFAGETEEKSRFIYSRYGNPSVQLFEEKMRALEGAEVCVAAASGMAAMAGSLLCCLKAGDHVVASRVLFGSCFQVLTTFLPRYGITYTLVDGKDLNAWEAAILPGETKILFCETPANPTLELVDLAGVSNLAKDHGLLFVVDNALASPAVQNPMKFGADVVTYSATKHIDGQGRCMGGAILCSSKYFEDYLEHYMRHLGPCMSPFNAWSLAKSMETLELRVCRMAETAQKTAAFLSKRKQVSAVLYPGHLDHPQYSLASNQMNSGGSIISFELPAGKAQAFKFLNALKLILISNNLGDSKSLATHPATTTHRTLDPRLRKQAGISDGLVRLSIGLEDSKDVIEDLDAALCACL